MDPFPGFAELPQTQHAYVYCLNNPVNHVDPSGEVIETVFDALMLVADAAILGYDLYYYLVLHPCASRTEMWAVLSMDAAAIALDTLSLLIPFLPGGGGTALRLSGRGVAVAAQVAAQVPRAWRVGSGALTGVQAARVLLALSTGGRGGGHRRGGSGSGKGGKPGFRTVEDAQRQVDKWKVEENLAHSDDWHLDAVRRERKGEVLPKSKPGGHIKEVSGSYEKLKKIRGYIDRSLRSSSWLPEARNYLLDTRSRIQTAIDRMWAALYGALP
jgi:hypothetical protein